MSGKDSESEAPILEKKNVKLSQLVYTGLSGTIGGTIYVIIGSAIDVAGAGILISLLFLGLLLILVIMNYSELSLSLPMLGGGYSFSKEAIGGFWGFIIGWLLWLGNLTFASVSGVGFAYSLSVFFPNRAGIEAHFIQIIGCIVVLVYFFMNLWAYKFLNKLMRVFTFILLVGFIIYIIMGLCFGIVFNSENFQPTNLSWNIDFSSILTVTPLLIGIFCVYEWNSSFDTITSKIVEIKGSKTKVPRAFMYSILIAIGIYILVVATTLINIGEPNSSTWNYIINSDNPLADTLSYIAGTPGLILIGFAGMICTMTSLQASMKMSFRVLYAMGRDGYLPKLITRQFEGTKRTDVSGPTVVISGLLIIIFTFLFNVEDLVSISNFIILLTLALISYSVILLRRNRPKLIRPYKVPFYPYIPILAAVSFLVLITPLASENLLIGIMMFLFGIIIYALKMARRDRIILLLSGMKIGGAIITILYLLSVRMMSSLIGIVLLSISIFAIASVFFDVKPISLIFKDIARAKNDDALIVSEIIEIDDKKKRFAYSFNIIIGIILICASIIFFACCFLLYYEEISFSENIFGISPESMELIGISIFIIYGIIILIGGSANIGIQLELKNVKI
ncbi:MAG: amino acid permease [Candidatus Lokiarchaeota archaeon]|nr:amino acid permease [Candidatus Lokiarchaeota archaeon]